MCPTGLVQLWGSLCLGPLSPFRCQMTTHATLCSSQAHSSTLLQPLGSACCLGSLMAANEHVYQEGRISTF